MQERGGCQSHINHCVHWGLRLVGGITDIYIYISQLKSKPKLNLRKETEEL